VKIYEASRSSAKKSFHGKLKTAEDKTLMQVEAKTARNNDHEAILQDGIPFYRECCCYRLCKKQNKHTY